MKTSSLLTAAFAVALSACLGAPTNSSSAQATLQLIEVAAPGQRFSVNATLQLEAYGVYSDGKKVKCTDEVTWSSSDESIIAIDQTGVARLIGAGQAHISATMEGRQGGVSLIASPAVTRSLELFPNDLFEAPRGLMPQLHVFATFSDGTRREVTGEARWSASGVGAWPLGDPGHFRLDAQGDVTLIARFGGLEARKDVRVLPPAVTALRLDPMNEVIRPGQSLPLVVVASYTDGSSRDVTADAQVLSLDNHIAGLSAGHLVAMAPGRARIVAQYEGFTASRAVLVTARVLVSLSSALPHADVPAGRSISFPLLATFDDGSVLEVSDLASWSSTSSEVADVTQGTVAGRRQGEVEITASYGGEQLVFTVAVQAPILEGIELTLPASRLLEGQLASFAVYGRFSDGAVLNLTPVAVLRSSPFVNVSLSSDYAIIEGVTAGPASVEAEVGGLITSVQLTVSDAQLEKLFVVRPSSDQGGLASELRAVAQYSDGAFLDVTELCHWRSSDPQVVQVDSVPGWRGRLSAVKGVAEISAQMLSLSQTFSVAP
ncbi:MAG: Ig-like domain-containing protein [Archangium sp.]|nr:Ig-like domain-containing protein [Archangium sp.]